MMTRCPAPPELLLYALQLSVDRESRDTVHHVSVCAACQSAVVGMREVASSLQLSAGNVAATENCLDEMTVANVVEQGVSMSEHPDVIAHLATCARCREQVTSVARLLRDPFTATEIRRIERSAVASVTRRWRVAGAGALTALAAAVAFIIASSGDRVGVRQPMVAVTDSETHREQSVTTTVAPSLIAPIGAVAAADSFSWTSVPRADLYRLTLFDREGTVVWEAEGSDTVMASPKSVIGERGYLWKVEARTGWDRWVESGLMEFLVSRTGRIQ